MKALMFPMMSMMMPYMKSIVNFGIGTAMIGLVYILFNINTLIRGHFGSGNEMSDLDNAEQRGSIGIVGKALIGVGLFFISCDLAGAYLSMTPEIIFGNDFDSPTIRFWLLGLMFLVAGLVYWMLSRRSAGTADA